MTTQPVWLIERGVYGPRGLEFRAEVKRQGMACFLVDYLPGRMPPDDLAGAPAIPDGACVVLRSALPLMQQIQLKRRWRPGGWCDLANLACSTYHPHFSPFLLNADSQVLRGVDAICDESSLFERFGHEDEIFVRPDGVQKLFPGGVVHREQFSDAIASTRFDPDTAIVVSTAKEIEREWRLVVCEHQPIAASLYRDQGAITMSPGCPSAVSEYAEDVLRKVEWRPDPVFMMDVCESNGKLHVLELNSFSCSGLYACNLHDVIQGTSRVAARAATRP